MVLDPGVRVEHAGGNSTRKAPYRKVLNHHRSTLRFYCRRYASDPRIVLAPVVSDGITLLLIAFMLAISAASLPVQLGKDVEIINPENDPRYRDAAGFALLSRFACWALPGYVATKGGKKQREVKGGEDVGYEFALRPAKDTWVVVAGQRGALKF